MTADGIGICQLVGMEPGPSASQMVAGRQALRLAASLPNDAPCRLGSAGEWTRHAGDGAQMIPFGVNGLSALRLAGMEQ